MVLKILVIILFAYGALLLFFGFTKNRFMIKMAKTKIGQDKSDAAAIKFMYICGLLLLVAGVVASAFAFR